MKHESLILLVASGCGWARCLRSDVPTAALFNELAADAFAGLTP